MKITRRRFLAGTGLTIAATAAGSARVLSAIESKSSAYADPTQPISIRDQFDLTKEYIHFATFYIASHPHVVQEAIEKYRRAINENPFLLVEHGMFEPDYENMPLKVKQAAADYFGAKPEEFAITNSTTMGLALVYNGLRIKPGQEILTTQHDHYSHHESIRLAADKNGATVMKIALFDNFDSISETSIVERIRAALRLQTRAVGVTWVHSSSGLKLPIRQIADMIRDANSGRDEADRILLIVDGVHGLGVEDDTADSLGCDFFCAGTHKWMFGPRGTGIIWARDWAWSQTRPTIPTFYDETVYEAWKQDRVPAGPTHASWVSPGGFHAFEHEWAVADAFRFHLRLGKKRVAEQIHSLNTQCKEGLARMPHVRIYTPKSTNLSAGLVCFDVDGMKPDAVVQKLLERKIIGSVTPYGVAYARLAPSLINTPQEIEAVLRAIHSMRAA